MNQPGYLKPVPHHLKMPDNLSVFYLMTDIDTRISPELFCPQQN